MDIEKIVGPIRTLPTAILGSIAMGEGEVLAHIHSPYIEIGMFIGGVVGAVIEHAALSVADRRDEQRSQHSQQEQ